MKTIFILYKTGDVKQMFASDDLYDKMKDDYKSDNYIKNEQAYIFFSKDEFLNELKKAEENKLF